MIQENLEIAQMLMRHPILAEKESYKVRYLNVLEYFVRRYSKDDLWAVSVLQLYVKQLLDKPEGYKYYSQDIKKMTKSVLSAKLKNFKFFSYRYCLVYDCMFINCMFDRVKAGHIFDEVVAIYNKRYENKIIQVFNNMYHDLGMDGEYDKIEYMKECWKANREYRKKPVKKILITANMSAGKSTLLNAIIGKKVNKTQNDSCTAKIHYILKKPYEDGFSYEWDYALDLNADYQTLMDDNESNSNDVITVGTYFRSVINTGSRIWFIDTPGVNSSQDPKHRSITEQAIKMEDSDLLLYLLNGENIGTYDDRAHLGFVKENYTGDILFAVNKVDRFKKKDDSVADTLAKVEAELRDIGFEHPTVVPVSSYAAYLAKMALFGERMNEDERDECELLQRKLQREEFQFDTYYPEEVRRQSAVAAENGAQSLLLHSGILQLEALLFNR